MELRFVIFFGIEGPDFLCFNISVYGPMRVQFTVDNLMGNQLAMQISSFHYH